jgi:hypothetical protein
MRTTTPDGQVAVDVGEIFGVVAPPAETAGYLSSVDIPAGVEQVDERREQNEGFGAQAKVTKYFRCLTAGEHRIEFVERRPWEKLERRTMLIVMCRP